MSGTARAARPAGPADPPPALIRRRGRAGFQPVHRATHDLPAALARSWTIVASLPGMHAQADLFIVREGGGPRLAVAKLYRPSFEPRSRALEGLSGPVLNHVVRVLERGSSEGIAYELLEYCRFGSLRVLLGHQAGDPALARTVLQRLSTALAAVHEAGRVHGELTPENILIRSLEPLELVLTDFAGASDRPAARGTGAGLRYAAPETLAGAPGRQADYWALGMILLELLTGRHPFEGLPEAALSHRLATQPVDLGAIADPDWLRLVRGLLARPPERRWGSAQLDRWLAGEPLADAQVWWSGQAAETQAADAPPAPAAVRALGIGDAQVGGAAELGAALLAHWEAGLAEFSSGRVAAWVRQELREPNLARLAEALQAERTLSPDVRLLRFALHAAPSVLPVWRGLPLTDAVLAAVVRAALRGHAERQSFLEGLYAEDVLGAFPPGHPDAPRLSALRERWRRRVDLCQQSQVRLARLEREARERLPAQAFAEHAGPLLFGSAARQLGAREPIPHALLLAPEFDPAAVDAARTRAAVVISQCTAFAGLGPLAGLAVESLAALESFGPRAARFAGQVRSHRARREAEARQAAAALRAEVDAMFDEARAFGRGAGGSLQAMAGLQGVYETFRRLYARAQSEAASHADFRPVLQALRVAGPAFQDLMQALDRMEGLLRLRALGLRDGWPLLLALVLLPMLIHSAALVLAEGAGLIVVLAGFLAAHYAAFARIRACVSRLPGKVAEPPGAPVGPP